MNERMIHTHRVRHQPNPFEEEKRAVNLDDVAIVISQGQENQRRPAELITRLAQ